MTKLVGKISDGVFINMATPATIRDIAARVREGAVEAGRDPASIEIIAKVPSEAWLTTHRPLNAMLGTERGTPRNFVSNKVLQLALGADMPPGVRMHVAGHIHFFQAVDFGGNRPPTLVVGTGGDALAQMAPMSVAGSDINGLPVINSVTRLGFGYMVWDRAGAEWNGTLYDVDGRPIDRCGLLGRSLSCGR